MPAHTLTVARWLAAHRRRCDIRPWQRAAAPIVQALLVLRWFKDAARVHLLARDAGVSVATACRYLHEAIDVIGAHAPGLHEVLAKARAQAWPFMCLDGTLVPIAQLHGPMNPSGADSHRDLHRPAPDPHRLDHPPLGHPIPTTPLTRTPIRAISKDSPDDETPAGFTRW